MSGELDSAAHHSSAMGAATLLSALTLLSLIAPAISDPISTEITEQMQAHQVLVHSQYLVIFPAIIRHPNTERFCVHLMTLQKTTHVTVTLEMTLQNHTLLEKDVERPETYECISFQVPVFVPKKEPVDPPYIWEEELASVHLLIREGHSIFEERKKVLVQHAYVRHIIETDKPFYKPGETVRFRIVKLDEEFKAFNETIPLIQLTDPNENRIGQWVDVKPQNGIVDLSFPLASEAAEGSYSIQVGSSRFWYIDSSKREFLVAEYELPKFEVEIEFPKLVTTADEEFQVKVCGKYTYGKHVQGNVKLRLIRELSYFFNLKNTNETLSDIEHEYTAQTDETGFAYFTINGSDLNLSQSDYAKYVDFVAELEEKGTGVTVTGNGFLRIAVKQVNMEFSKLNPFYKKGFPYTGEMKASINDVPIKNWTVYLTVDIDDVETTTPYVTDENGEVSFSLDTTKWHDMVSLRGRYTLENVTGIEGLEMSNSECYKWLKPFYSESNSFLEIQHVEEKLPCGKDQEVLVDYIIDRNELVPDADHVDFYYLIISKGKIVSSGQKTVPVGQDYTLKGTFSLTFSTSSDLAPTVRLLLYTVFIDGEVVADVDQFEIQNCFKHKVALDFSAAEDLPGSKVNLQLEAAPGALCSLRAVDKSVLLLENETLTPEKVFGFFGRDHNYLTSGRGFPYHLEDFDPYPCLPPSQKQKRALKVAPWYQSEADAFSLFKLMRLKVFTNMQLKKPVSCDLPITRRLKSGLERGQPTDVQDENLIEAEPQAVDSTGSKKEKKAKPRTHFPETWVWDLVAVNEEGKATHSVTAPDTITEWNADAFCVADIGFGLSGQAKFRVFQPFFVDLTLPYSVVRGETFLLKSTVFNYIKECIQVKVTLLESQEVDVKPCPACQFSTCLCSEEAHTFSWNVTATQLGHVNLSVTAEAEETHDLCGNKISTTPPRGRSDTVVKALLVKPEGVLEEETHNVFLCSSGDPVHDEVSLKLPEAVVEGSGRATVSCIGDILGTSLQHIGALVQLPLGCGEQNLMKFVPNIHILRYLEKTNQATPIFKEEVIKYTQSGYQRQLLYKRDNGSYSAFGKRDAEGNTWLTAAVVKGFGLAKSYVYVDEKHIQDAVHWLGQHQLPSGCFESVGRVFNNAIKGGVDDEISLTAYVAASLLELNIKENHTIVDDALGCLKRNLSSVDGAYTKALLAYVFTLSGDTEIRQNLLKDLHEEADKRDGIVSLSDIETTAYYLLALLSTPEVSTDVLNHASQVVPSITSLQSLYGGFSSTQNTLVALQALSRYAALTYREAEDVKVLVKSSGGFQHEFHVGKKNRLVLQQAPLVEVPGQYKLEVSGNGCAYVQTTLRYHKEPPPSEAFALSVETSPQECNQTTRKYFDVHVQVSYTGERNETNMILIEVNMLSGYIPVKKSVKQLLVKPLVKKVEFEPDKIQIYLDKLDSDVQNYSVSVEQETEVLDLKPAIVKVYDYYHPEDSADAEYNAPCSTESTKKDHH